MGRWAGNTGTPSRFLRWPYFCLTAPGKGQTTWSPTTARCWIRQTKALYLRSAEVEAWPGRRDSRKQWSTGKLPWTKPKHYRKNMKTQGKKFHENTVIGYLYVNDSSRSPRLSHSVNCLAVHLAANSWLNLNILWLKWMHQRLRHRKVTRFSLSSTSRCTSIPLMLALTYPLGLCLVHFWLSQAVKKRLGLKCASHLTFMDLLNPSLAMYQWPYSSGCETVHNFSLLWT